MKKISPWIAAFACCASVAVSEERVTLSDLVVTPTGSEKEAFDTSLPINLLKTQDIERKIPTSIGDLLDNEPGVDVVSSGPGSIHPMIRGLYGERILVLVDGIRLSEQRPGGNHAFSLDPAQIEQVEVVRGPASVLYGSDAIGGVINFLTKRADEETSPELRVNGEAEIQFDSATEGIKETGFFRFGEGRFNGHAGASFNDADNIETPEGELANSFYEGVTLWGGGNYIGEGWKVLTDYAFTEADIGVPSPPAFKDDYFNDERHQRLAFGFETTDRLGSIDALSLDFGWQRHDRNRYRRKISGLPPVLAGDLEVGIMLDIDTYTFKPQIILALAENHRVTAGIDTFFETASSDRTMRDSASPWVNPMFDKVPVIPDSTRTGIGAYVQDETTLGDRWVFTPGLRADWIEAQTDGHPRHQLAGKETSSSQALSGNLGLLYKAGNEVNLYGNVGRAFRAPTLLELYFYGPHDVGNDIGDPGLDPETSWNFDCGIKTKNQNLQTMVGVFYNIIDDYIVKENQGNGDYQYKNYTEVNLYGFEAGAEYALGGGFTAFSTLAYVCGKDDKTSEDLSGMPPLKVNYGMRCETAVSADTTLWLEISGLTAADQNKTGANERETDGYTRGDIRLGLDLGQNWSFVAAAENFTDKLYQDHLSSSWQEFGLNDQAGRSLKFMAKARF